MVLWDINLSNNYLWYSIEPVKNFCKLLAGIIPLFQGFSTFCFPASEPDILECIQNGYVYFKYICSFIGILSFSPIFQ